MLLYLKGGANVDRVAWHRLKDSILLPRQAKSIKKYLWAQSAQEQQKEIEFNSVREHLNERVFVLSTGAALKAEAGSCGEHCAWACSLQHAGADESAGTHISKEEKLWCDTAKNKEGKVILKEDAIRAVKS